MFSSSRVGAGLLHHLRVADPAAGGDAVEAGDHRNVTALFGLPQVIQVGLGTEVVADHLREVADSFPVAVGGLDEEPVKFPALEIDLLFEERVQDNGACPGVFQTQDVADVLAEWR